MKNKHKMCYLSLSLVELIKISLTYLFYLQILYTGDFSREEDRHLMAAEIPNVTPDILITVRQSKNI